MLPGNIYFKFLMNLTGKSRHLPLLRLLAQPALLKLFNRPALLKFLTKLRSLKTTLSVRQRMAPLDSN
jgi:hypothetical protein